MPTLKQLHVQELRLNLYWGARYGVAKRRPAHAGESGRPGLRLVALRPRRPLRATSTACTCSSRSTARRRGRTAGSGRTTCPTNPIDLRNFALAAAKRYGGQFPDGQGGFLPPVREWLAWNEPNNPLFLSPQYKGNRRSRARSTTRRSATRSTTASTRRCSPNERVACGVTGAARQQQPAQQPAVRLAARVPARRQDGGPEEVRRVGASPVLRRRRRDTPTTKPVGARGGPPTAVTLGNFSDLTKLLTQLYGNKRIWITEYGYQTNPPDTLVGVSWAKQALYLTQAFAIARENPRIDMMLWFLLKDEPTIAGWQSGLDDGRGEEEAGVRGLPEAAPVAVTLAAMADELAQWPGAERRNPPHQLADLGRAVVRSPRGCRRRRPSSRRRTPVRILDVGCGVKPYYPFFAERRVRVRRRRRRREPGGRAARPGRGAACRRRVVRRRPLHPGARALRRPGAGGPRAAPRHARRVGACSPRRTASRSTTRRRSTTGAGRTRACAGCSSRTPTGRR